MEWTELRGDDQVRTATAALFYDDFSGALETEWTPLVLDPAETRRASWRLDAGVLRQDVDIAGGDASPESPDKPGTVYLAEGVAAADVALETHAWATSGAYGLIFRWRDPRNYYRFSVGLQRFRLVRVSDGVVTELWSRVEGYVPDAPTLLAVQTEGSRIRCQVGERLVCDISREAPGPGDGGRLRSVHLELHHRGLRRAAGSPVARLHARARSGLHRGARGQPAAVHGLFREPRRVRPAVLATGDAVHTCSASAGTATIARPARRGAGGRPGR